MDLHPLEGGILPLLLQLGLVFDVQILILLFRCEDVVVGADQGEFVEGDALLAIVNEVSLLHENVIDLLLAEGPRLDVLEHCVELLVVTHPISVQITRREGVLHIYLGLGDHASIFRQEFDHELIKISHALLE